MKKNVQAGRRGWRQGLEMSPSEGHLRVREAEVCRGGSVHILDIHRRRRGRPLRIFLDVVKEGWSDRGGPYLLMFGGLGETNTDASTSCWSCIVRWFTVRVYLFLKHVLQLLHLHQYCSALPVGFIKSGILKKQRLHVVTRKSSKSKI